MDAILKRLAQIDPTIVERKEPRFKDRLLDLTIAEPNETRFQDRLLVLVFSSIPAVAAGGSAGSMTDPKEQEDPQGERKEEDSGGLLVAMTG